MLRLAPLLALLLFACHPPQAREDSETAEAPRYGGRALPNPWAKSDDSSADHDPAPEAEPQEPGRGFELDPDFDLFEDESAGASGEPFTDAILQERVAAIAPRVAEMRGMEFLHEVPAGLQSADEFIAFAIEDFEREYGMETFEAMSEAYRLLGLIEPELQLFDTTMELLRGQVGGYYDPRSKRFYMIDSFVQGAMADIILAHELTHALDDQHFDLKTLMERAETADEEFAIRAVVEGSGTSLMNLYAIQGAMAGWLELDPVAMMEQMEDQAESLEAAPPYLIMTLALPYLEGNKFLTRQPELLQATLTPPTDADLRAAFAAPPRSSEQVLHFEKYWDPEQRDEPILVSVDGIAAQLGEGWVLESEDVLGELGCFVVTAPSLPDMTSAAGQMAGKWTNAAATGWGGDRYASCLGPEGQRVLIWDTIWDTEADAVEFAAALEADPAPKNPFLRGVQREGRRVRGLYADAAGVAALARLEGAE